MDCDCYICRGAPAPPELQEILDARQKQAEELQAMLVWPDTPQTAETPRVLDTGGQP